MDQNNNNINKFLDTVIPADAAANICELYDIELKPGSTFKDALNASLLKRAENGDKKALKLAKRYGIHE